MANGRRNVLPLIVAGLIGVLLIVGARLIFSGSGDEPSSGDPTATQETFDPNCTQVTVAASSEKAALLRDLAAEYNATRPEVNGTCVQFRVVSKASGGAAEALARGWDERVDGPRPDVWSPASSSWAVLVEQRLAAQDKPNIIPKDYSSLVQTPLVVAMPRPMAEALGWPDQPIGWSDLLDLATNPKGWGAVGHPEWGKFKLGKTNPHFSTSGLNATIASYFAATGLSSDLTVADVQDPDTREYVKTLESSVVHYGDTTLTFLDNMYRAAEQGKGLTYVSAVTVEEKSVWDYNEGNPTGDPAKAGQQPPPSVPLAAVYPSEGTLLSDNPWVILDADWADDTKQTAAAGFLTWLQRPEAQEQFQAFAFRSYEGVPGEVINEANGMIPTEPTVILAPPAPSVLKAVEDSWDELRKRARVLMVLDVSGSMGEPVPDAGASKIDLAKQATIDAVEGFAPDDEVGLWIFSTELDGPDKPYLELVPIGPAKDTVPLIVGDVENLVADGGTGLYATLKAGQKQMVADLDTGRINAIVLLSDGRNEYPPDTDLDGLLRQLDAESVDTSVRVFAIGYGDSADRAALEAIAEASRGAYYDASDPASIGKVLTSVLSNF
ncbi:MAG: substrate-binding and VWA domain-containing protein [Candidatus Nanopelagicales bacterium]